MNASYFLVLLALLMPLAMCYPQPAMDEDKEQEYGEMAQSDDGDGDDSNLEGILRMIQQKGGDEDEDGGENALVMQDEDENDEAGMQAQKRCATHIYVMGFTSGSTSSGSDHLPYLFVDLYNHEEGFARFPNNPGNDMLENKGDFWKFSLKSDLKLKKSCITKADINKIVVHNGGNDGWKIESIFTILRSGSYYTVVTANVGLNKFVDGNPNRKNAFHQISLTKTYNS
jgi:hypothetical protein